jgi:omega-hydroxy-beta-dihydromenaquinone-9 sulfotransferase
MLKSIEILRILRKSFGFQFKHIAVMLFRLSLGIYAKATLFMDYILFPGLKLVKPQKPVFLIGHPRSGTTFLHRFIANNCVGLRAMYVWEMAFPSLFARKMIKLIKSKLRKISFDKIWDPKIHKTNFFEVDTEDFALFLRMGDGLLPWLYFYIWDNYNSDDEFKKKLYDVCDQDKFVDYLISLHKKNVYKTNKRIFSKSFALIFNIDKILGEFPDANFLLMMRDPKAVIPSTLSLISGAQNKLNGLDKAPEYKKMEFYNKVYKTSIIYYRLMDKILMENRNNVMLITHKELMSEFDVIFRKLMEFYEIEIDEKLENAIREQVEKQKVFKSEHKYSLDTYGFNEEQIKKDFAFIYEKYAV